MAINLYGKTLYRRSLSPAARTNGTANGAAVDTAEKGGADDVLVAVITGTITDGTHAITVEESADGSTGWAAVPAGRIQGSQPTIAAANDDTHFLYGVETSARYLRVVATTSGATTGGLFAAGIIIGDCRQEPVV